MGSVGNQGLMSAVIELCNTAPPLSLASITVAPFSVWDL